MKKPKIFLKGGLWYCRKPPCGVQNTARVIGSTVQEAIEHVSDCHPLKPRPKLKRKEKETAAPLMQIIGKIKSQ